MVGRLADYINKNTLGNMDFQSLNVYVYMLITLHSDDKHLSLFNARLHFRANGAALFE